ncbi:unnamed protein product, partial [Rotaria sp. Silwood1]
EIRTSDVVVVEVGECGYKCFIVDCADDCCGGGCGDKCCGDCGDQCCDDLCGGDCSVAERVGKCCEGKCCEGKCEDDNCIVECASSLWIGE